MDFRLLGPLEVWDGARPVRIRGAKERSLLAMLLLHANELVSTDRLIDGLWGDEPPESARGSLQVRVSHLRKALEAGGELLVSTAAGYLVRVGPDQLDLHRFEGLLAEGDRALARHDPAVASESLRKALALWRGPALADYAGESFAQAARARLEAPRAHSLGPRCRAGRRRPRLSARARRATRASSPARADRRPTCRRTRRPQLGRDAPQSAARAAPGGRHVRARGCVHVRGSGQ